MEIRVDDATRLFEAIDASPFGGQHLDEKIERFILHLAQEGRCAKYTLVVRMPAAPPENNAAGISTAIRQHFAHRAREETTKLLSLVSDGKRDAAIGLAFLFTCGLLRLLALKLLPSVGGLFVEQGLLIIGWVALWRPADLFLYELRPLRRQRDLLLALSRMEVRFERS